MKEFVDKVKYTSVKSLTRLMLSALENAALQIEAQAMKFTKTQLPPIREESQAVAERFITKLNSYFDMLGTNVEKDTLDIDSEDMSLIDHDYLEALIAMKGMVERARESDTKQYISFTTRLSSLYHNTGIGPTNNPLDPEQIGDCFNEAIRPMGLKAHYLLTIYREFNKTVFKNLEEVLAEANQVLIDLGVLPNLDVKARNRELMKAKRDEDRAVAATREPAPEKSNNEMFAVMQTLISKLVVNEGTKSELPVSQAPANEQAVNTATVDLVAEQQSLRKQHEQLMQALTNIQLTLAVPTNSESRTESPVSGSESIAATINQSLNDGASDGALPSINAESSNVINLVTMLYGAIWKDDSLPIAMKELIGRTQIPIMKVALTDTTFFNNEQHPGRVILNEFAVAGISWTRSTELDSDPVYLKVKELVERLLNEADINNDFLQSLINALREINNQRSGVDASLEQRVRKAETEVEQSNLGDVKEFVSQIINGRILKSNLDPSIKSLLDNHMHAFLVKLVLKEGLDGSSWKPVMSTIDVLLWTVQADKQPGDKEKFDKINPRLLDNLAKALEIGGASKTKITKIIRQLKQVQDYSFHQAAVKAGVIPIQSATAASNNGSRQLDRRSRRHKTDPPLPHNDPHLRQVDKLPLGSWMEFRGATGTPVRATLAAKIDSIDKLFFADQQGAKVVELTRSRLARELKAGSVKIVSEGSLMNRAMEAVMSDLQESAQPLEDAELGEESASA